MKRYTHTLLLTGAILLSSLGAVGCQEQDKPSTNSIFSLNTPPQNEFDKWLKTNYIDAFNIDYIYRLKDIEADRSYNHAPADLGQSMRLARVIKHVWLDAYVEVAGIDFMRKNAPAILHVIGSAAWNEGGTMTLGTAEGGLKITLYLGNWFDIKNIKEMNEYYFKTMHHEFTHILQQTHNYPQEYNTISAADYRPSGWQNRNLEDAAKLGFITQYAGSMAVEDITEVTCCYATYSDEEWKKVYNMAGKEGQAKLDQKLEIMMRYMREVWSIDMDELKSVVARRMKEAQLMQLIDPSWKYLLENGISANTGTGAMEILRSQLIAEYPDVIKDMTKYQNRCQIHNANLIHWLGVPSTTDPAEETSTSNDHDHKTHHHEKSNAL